METKLCAGCKHWNPVDRERSHSGLCVLASMNTAFNDGCRAYESFQVSVKAGQPLGYHPNAVKNYTSWYDQYMPGYQEYPTTDVDGEPLP